jgi:hypothetical protein
MTVGRGAEDGHLEEVARMALADELAYLTATELVARIRRRELSPVEVTDACIERIQARNDSLDALVYVGFDDARQRAREAEQADDQRLRWSSSRSGLVQAAVKWSGSCPIRVDRPKDRDENASLHNRWGSLRRASAICGDEAPTSIGHTGGGDYRLGMRVPRPQFGRQ